MAKKTRAQLNAELEADYNACLEKFSGLDEAAAIKTFEDVYKVKLSKNLMAAFIKTYHADDFKKFVEKSNSKKEKYVYNPVIKGGKIIYSGKTDKKGNPIPKKEKVYTGVFVKNFDINLARKNFVADYGITLKETSFTPNTKGVAKFDPFAM